MADFLDLPGPIAAYFAADQRDGGAVAGCFSTDGIVKDEGRTYAGSAAIKRWREEAAAKYTYSVVPFALQEKDGRVVVTSRVTGNFPGGQVELRYAFKLDRSKIGSLEITS